MKRKFEIAEDKRKNSTFYTTFLLILVIAYTFLFVIGCQESLKTAFGGSSNIETDNLFNEADRIIRDALADDNPGVRSKAIEVIVETKQVRLMPKVHRLLEKDQTAPVRFLAILAVGDLRYSLAKKDVVSLLKDENENIRIAAAYAMTKLGAQQYYTVFRNAIASKDQTVRANAAFLLGKNGNREALRFLYWALMQKDSADKVLLQALESIAMLRDEQIYPKLWTRLISAYADDRVIGIRAMGALGTEQAKNALITMLDDGVLEVRLAAAQQLGRLNDRSGESEALDVFTNGLTSGMGIEDRERVIVLTALAIGEIGTDKLKKYLPQLLQDESKFIRIAAAKAVFQCEMKK
jgi:HEAT repeat protein